MKQRATNPPTKNCCVLLALTAALFLLFLFPAAAQAATEVSYVERSWSGGDTTGSVTETTKTVSSYTSLTSNTRGSTTLSGGWKVLDSSVTYSSRLTIATNTKLVLCDGCTLTAQNGIYIKDGATLTVYGQSGDSGKIIASSDSDPGIGGLTNTVGGSLVIHGGTIEATGYKNAAGIGGGNHKSGMRNITIYGGSVTAKGGSSGAGIGKGQQNDTFGTVTIYGGTVNATGGSYGAGIGGGEDRGSVKTLIYGGTVTANGGHDGAGIGGGEQGSGADNPITIYGGTVTATGGKWGAGIGGGEKMSGGTVTIKGGTVTATGGFSSAGIGGSKFGDGGTVSISNATVTATGTMDDHGLGGGAGIGSGYHGDGGTITIFNATVNAYGANYSAGIGGSKDGPGCTVRISGDSNVTAHGGYSAPCIGGGKEVNITISGGTVTADNKGRTDAPAIGTNIDDGVLNFTMDGGNVYAKVDDNNKEEGYTGAGVGGAAGENVKVKIRISGGTLEAYGGSGGAGIGAGGCKYIGAGASYNGGQAMYTKPAGGDVKSGSEIIISDTAKVTAIGGSYGGAGIGSGLAGEQKGTITIKGGTVIATGRGGGAGIGGGYAETTVWWSRDTGAGAGTIKISGGTVTATAEDYVYGKEHDESQAIGHGDTDSSEGSPFLGDDMCVRYDDKTANREDRVARCNDHGKRIVEVCTHSDDTYTITEETHLRSCKYCKTSFDEEPHTMDESNTCTVCGYQGPACTVSFDANGASGEMAAVRVAPGREYTLPAPSFTAPENKAFAGWSVKLGDTEYGTKLPGETVTVPDGTTDFTGTATAQWSDQCRVSFDANGGDGSMNNVMVGVGSTYTLPECTYTPPSGKLFSGWSVSNVDGTGSAESKYPGDKVTVDTHKKVTATWGDKVTVTLEPGKKVSGTPIADDMLKGGTYTLPTAETCGFTAPENWTFKEWSVKVGSGDAQSMQPGQTIDNVAANTTVTAKWTSEWKELQSLLSKGGEVKLDKDYTAADGDDLLGISAVNVTLDLNGHTVDGSACKSLLRIGENGSLTLKDSVGSGELVYEPDSTNQIRVVEVLNTGSFTMDGGKVSTNGRRCDGVYVHDGARFAMNGGKLICRGMESSCVFVCKEGSFSIKGSPQITQKSDKPSAFAVFLQSGSKIAIGGPLSRDTLIDVKTETSGIKNPFTSGLGGNNTALNFKLHVSDSDDYAIGIDEDGEAYKDKKLKVEYKKGDEGASGSMETEYVAASSMYILPVCTFTAPEGKHFKDWSVRDRDGNEVSKHPGDAIPVLQQITVTATWDGACSVTLNPGEGSGDPVKESVVKNGTFTLPFHEDCSFTSPQGYVFKEWSVKVGNGDAQSKQPKETVSVTANTTVTALWQVQGESSYALDDDEVITKAPTGNALAYNGQPQELVTAGVAADGTTMQYALGTATEATGTYAPSIPTETNAGTYFVWYKAVSDTSGAESEANQVSATIKPVSIKDARVVVDSAESTSLPITYDGNPHKVFVKSVTLGVKQLDEDSDYSVVDDNGLSATSAGTHYVYVKGKGNYEDIAMGTWEILEGTIGATADDVEATYDGSAHGIVVDVTEPKTGAEVMYGDNADEYGLTESPTLTDVGSRTVYWRVTAENYQPLEGSTTITVTQRAVTVSGIGADSKPYDGTQDATLDYSKVTINPGIVQGDDITVKATGLFDDAMIGDDKVVSISNITLVGAKAKNYSVDTDGSQKDTRASITSNDLGVLVSGYEGTYDGTPHSITVSNPRDATITYSYYLGDTDYPPAFTEPGSYDVTWDAVLGNERAHGTVRVTIDRRPVTVSGFTAYNKTWDGTPRADLDNSSVSVMGTVGEEKVTATATGTFRNAAAGENRVVDISNIVLGGTHCDNYVLAEVGSQETCSATIFKDKSELVDHPTARSPIYNGTPQELVNPGSADGGTLYYSVRRTTPNNSYYNSYVLTAQANEWSTEVPKETDAGTYVVSYMVRGDGNHTDTEEDSLEVTIRKAEINPTVTIADWTEGQTPSAPHVTGNPGNGDVTYRYGASGSGAWSANAPTTPGSYDVLATIAETHNYFGGTASAPFAVSAKAEPTPNPNPSPNPNPNPAPSPTPQRPSQTLPTYRSYPTWGLGLGTNGYGAYGYGAYGHAPSYRTYDSSSDSSSSSKTTTTPTTTDGTSSKTGTITISKRDTASPSQGTSTIARTTATAGKPGVKRLAGKDRYQTMTAISTEGFASSSRAVVATGTTFADALAASGLAGAMKCPVVLTDGSKLSTEAKSELSRLGVKSVTIVGGSSAVSEVCRLELEAMGINVTRVSGADRQATCVAAMGSLRAQDGSSDTVVVTSGSTFADALSCGPWAWKSASPVVLASADGTLTREALDAIRADKGIKRVLVVGGNAAVSAKVEEQLAGYAVERVGGADRYETSALVARWSTAHGMSLATTGVATGRNFPDALAASALLGSKGGVLLLADTGDGPAARLLSESKGQVKTLYVLGGASAVSDAVAEALAATAA